MSHGPVVKTLPCNAEEVDPIPSQATKTPCASRPPESMCYNYWAHGLWSPWATLENAYTVVKDPTGHNKDPVCHEWDLMQPNKWNSAKKCHSIPVEHIRID